MPIKIYSGNWRFSFSWMLLIWQVCYSWNISPKLQILIKWIENYICALPHHYERDLSRKVIPDCSCCLNLLMIAICKVNVEVQKISGSSKKKVGKQTTYSTSKIPQCIPLMKSFTIIALELNFPQKQINSSTNHEW